MKREEYERRFHPVPPRESDTTVLFQTAYSEGEFSAAPEMGLAPGGRMRQQIYADTYGTDAWDADTTSRCFVHLANTRVWTDITGGAPPTRPPSVTDYIAAGLPWFEWYDELPTVGGTEALRRLKSVVGGTEALRRLKSVGPAADPGDRVREWE